MTLVQPQVTPELKQTGRRVGYGVAIVINVVMLVIVQNILAWGWLPFLTEEFSEVVPWISFSLGVSILVNVVYLFDDRRGVKATGQILTNLIAMVVTYRMLQVFPFDFSAYEFDWAIVARVVLILAIVGSALGAIAEIVKLASGASKRKETGDGVGT